MQVILQGSLRHFPAAELLSFLCHPERKGTLDIETQGRRTRILFSGEHVVWAESKNVSEPVDAVLEAFAADTGSFTLLDSLELPPYAQPLSLTLEALHEERQRRAEAGPYGDETVFRVVENPAQQQVSLSGEEFKILFRVSTGRTLAELVSDLGIDRKELATRLQSLEELGLIAVAGQEPVTEPHSAPPPPHPFAKPESPKTVPPNRIARDAEPAAAEPEPPPPPPPPPQAAPAPAAEDAEATRIERPAVDRAAVAAAPEPMERQKTLVGSLTPDDASGSVFPLLDSECVIGRAPENGISIPDGSVSSRHARIIRNADGFVIEDLKSRNGTFVNGEKVEQPRLLADGDVVRVGKIIMTFNVAQETIAAAKTQMMRIE